jgi:hypothetical protein
LLDRHYKEFLRSQVIKDSLKGKTREVIAKENGTSTGNVSHILRDFEKKIGESSVGETIEFARIVRKSGITMDQCLEGYRMYMLIEKIGFNNCNDNNDKNKDFQDFVNKIYFTCKDIGIDPAWIFTWIEDLLNLTVKVKKILPLNSIYEGGKAIKHDANSLMNALNIYPEQYTERSKLENDNNQLSIINCNSAADATLSETEETNQSFRLSYSEQPNSSPSNFHGLLLSDIVNLISQIQNEGKTICNYHYKIKSVTTKLENTFTKVKDALQMTKIRNQKILHFEHWFYRTKQQLWRVYDIRLETDLPKFINSLNEFNRHNYDSYEILNEYMKHQSLDHEIAEKNNIIQGQKGQINTLEGHIISISARLECKKIMQTIVEKFESINFEVDDLARIHNLIVETASVKNIPVQRMVKIVIDDMEKNHYNSILFSDLATKRKAEYTDLIRQQSYYNTAFEENYYCKVVLAQLLNRGISQENIINLNLMITEIEKKNLYGKNIQNNDPDKTIDIKAVNMVNNYNALIAHLRKYVTLDIACEEKQHELDEINKQIYQLIYNNKPPILQISKIASYTFFTNYRIPYDLL